MRVEREVLINTETNAQHLQRVIVMMSLYGQNFVSRLLLAKAHLETMAGNLQVAIIYTIATVLVVSTVFENHQKSHFSHQFGQFGCYVIQIEWVKRGCVTWIKPCLKITTMATLKEHIFLLISKCCSLFL